MLEIIKVAGFYAKNKLVKLFKNESGEVNIVAIVVLIGIAVLLALVFKNALSDLFETLWGAITGNATKGASESMPPVPKGG